MATGAGPVPEQEHQADKPRRLSDLPREKWGFPGSSEGDWPADQVTGYPDLLSLPADALTHPTTTDLSRAPIKWRNRP